MKIAFLAPRYHTNQISMVKYLLENNHKVSFYVIRLGEIEDHSLLKPSLINLNIVIKIFKYLIRSNNPLFDYRYGIPSINELIKFKLNKFDLIIIRDPLNLISLTYLLWAKITGVRIIFYIQREVHKKKSFQIKEMIERFLISACNSQCISPCLGNLKYNKFTKNVTYLPFSLHTNNYKKKWFLNNKVNILTIGKFINRKNHRLLIHALSKLKNKYNFQLTIIGECSNKEHQINLKEIKEEIIISGLNVNILNNINSTQVIDNYKNHDILVLPSVYEPASVSNLEAMSFGLPVITTDTNNTSCYTENNKNGFIVKSNNIESLKDKIEFFLNNKDLIMKFGNESLNIVKIKYNPDINYKRYFEGLINS